MVLQCFHGTLFKLEVHSTHRDPYHEKGIRIQGVIDLNFLFFYLQVCWMKRSMIVYNREKDSKNSNKLKTC